MNSTPPEIQGPQQPDQRRFDHVLAIEEVVAIRFVLSNMNAAAYLRKDHETHILIFEMDRPIASLCSLLGDTVREGIRINLAATALIDPLLQKHWIGIGRSRYVRLQGNRFFPRSHRFNHISHTTPPLDKFARLRVMTQSTRRPLFVYVHVIFISEESRDG